MSDCILPTMGGKAFKSVRSVSVSTTETATLNCSGCTHLKIIENSGDTSVLKIASISRDSSSRTRLWFPYGSYANRDTLDLYYASRELADGSLYETITISANRRFDPLTFSAGSLKEERL